MNIPYSVRINGKASPLEPTRVSAIPFNRTWPGKQRELEQSKLSYILRVFEENPITVEISTAIAFDRVTVRPLSRNVPVRIETGQIVLTLNKHGNYVVELGDRQHTIYVFYDRPYQLENTANPTYSFGPGEHFVGLLTLHTGESVFLDRGAVVYGSIFADSASDIHIFGQGTLNGSWEHRTKLHGDIGWDNEDVYTPESVHTYGGIRLFRCKNVLIQDITVTDPASYAISLYDSEKISIENTKVVGLWKYNTDGIDLINCRHAQLNGCFIHSFDDCTCQKGFTAFSNHSVEDITVRGCVLWCDWGKVFDLGLASAAPEMKNILFEDCDIIYGMHSCITISNGQWADIHDVTYRNIRIEYSPIANAPVYQESDDQRYISPTTEFQPALVQISDNRRNWQGHRSLPDTHTKIRNIRIENIFIHMDESIHLLPLITVTKTTSESRFENIEVHNVQINGKLEPKLEYIFPS